MPTNEKPEQTLVPQAAEAAPSVEALIERCMQRATKVTIRKRHGKKGTSITISFSKPR